MPIYEKPTRELLHDFADQNLQAGTVFAKPDAVRWFSTHYPKIKSNTVALHVEGMCVNSRTRKHHPHIRKGAGWDLFFKLGPKEYRLYDPETDPKPIYKEDIEAEDAENENRLMEYSDDDEMPIDSTDSKRFAFERDLQNYLIKNLSKLEPGLTLYEDEDGQFSGVEFPVGQRYIDILAVGADGAFVVIETKVSRAYDRVVGQILRYMGWIRDNMASGKPIRGIIVASEISSDLKLATSFIQDIKLFEYEISFFLKNVE